MTSNEKLSLIQTVVENTSEHDFVSPQISVDSTHQREMEAAQTYILKQTVTTVQTLRPLYDTDAPSYMIRLDTIGSFLKPQPHMVITQDPGGFHVAEVKFQIHGYDATIIYKKAGTCQKVALHNPQDQMFECLINGRPHRWQPLGPSKSVFELTEEANRRVALFVYGEGMAHRTGSTSSDYKSVQEQIVGEVHVMRDFLHEPTALQQTLFTAVVVVEQAKRRLTSLTNLAPPSTSKSSFPARRRSRQDGVGEG